MKKIKTMLIHWLGGYVMEDREDYEQWLRDRVCKLEHECINEYLRGEQHAYECVQGQMRYLYGQPADSQLKDLWEFITSRIKNKTKEK